MFVWAAPTWAGAAPAGLAWRSCPSPAQSGFQCATLRVPLDYRHPHGRVIRLALIRHLATDRAQRIGTLFYNPGGPGNGGTTTLPAAFETFPAQVRARFDIASWDPRGVGSSTAVQCFASPRDETRFFAGTGLPPPTFPVGRLQMSRSIRRARQFARVCERRNASLLRHVSTADTARDLERLRRAVGDPKLNYVGVSYGTFLGATYANLFPNRVRAMVLTSNTNPTAWVHPAHVKDRPGLLLPTFLRQGSDGGAAKTLRAFLDLCGRTDTPHCAFSAGSAAATRAKFDALLQRVPKHATRGKMSYAELVSGTVNSLNVTVPGWSEWAKELQSVWTTGGPAVTVPPTAPTLATELPPADGAHLATVSHRYAGIEQILAIICSESPNPSAASYPRLDRFANHRSGAVGRYFTWFTESCETWPAAADPYPGPWDRRTANPILLIGTTNDPATPYRGSVAMARQLARARLLTVNGYGHPALSDCADRYISRYFISRTLPPKGASCQGSQQPFSG